MFTQLEKCLQAQISEPNAKYKMWINTRQKLLDPGKCNDKLLLSHS